jgi:Tol biopolymer transport system component
MAVFATSFYFHFSEKNLTPIVAFLPPPDRATIEFGGDAAGPPVISPDGHLVAFTAASVGTTQLWLRVLDAEKAQPLADTEGASFPFWSADSRSIGFFANGKLERIDVGGGTPMSLCDAPLGRGGTWSKDGVIVFAPDFRSGLFRVSASGGIPVAVTKVDSSKHSTHRWPYFLPDGKHFLFLALNHASPAGENTAIYVASLDGKENRALVHSKASAIYASGHLLFLHGNTLMAQPFDAGRRELTGERVPVAANIQSDPGTWRPVFSASDTGLLIYEGTELNGTQLTWFDRSGKRVGTLGDREHYGSLRISPRGDKVAVELGEPSDIWIYDAVRGVRTRLTFNPAQDATAVWSPDESQIVFTSEKDGHPNLYRKAADGTGSEELLLASDAIKEAQDWSADGRFLIYMQAGAGSLGQLWILPLFGDRKPFPFVPSPFSTDAGTFSPDGRWVAYASDESGRSEVYVVPFRGLSSADTASSSAGKWQVSASGGIVPFWRRDGQELLYIEPGLRAPFSGRTEEPGAKLMAVQVSTTGSEFKIGKARALFPIPPGSGLDATPDGQRFLIEALGEQSSAPLTLLVNWTAKLKP